MRCLGVIYSRVFSIRYLGERRPVYDHGQRHAVCAPQLTVERLVHVFGTAW